MKLDFLERDELERVTCRKTARAMARRLIAMQVPYLLDGDGWPLVLRSNIDRACTPDQLTNEQQKIIDTDEEIKLNLIKAFAKSEKQLAT